MPLPDLSSVKTQGGLPFQILHCIGQLYKLQVTVTILQETGVGRTVNGLCKSEAGDVRLAAKSLINKWKALVANESSTEEELARHSQEEVEDTRKHNSSGSLRKDSDRIKKERDNRSEHQHHRKTSRHDREGRHEERPKNHRSADSAAPSVEAKSIEKYHPQGDHAAVSGSTSKYTPGETSSSSEKPPRDRRSNGGDEKERKRSREHDRRHPDKERSSKRHKHESTKHLDEEKDDEDVEIDNTAGTSFADALAMMDGPSMPAKTSTTKSVTKTPTSNSSTSDAPKTKGSTYKPSSSSVSTSYSPAVAAPVNKANSKAGSSSSAYRASRPSDAGSGPPKLLAPSFKLAPLALDPDELKRDIMAASAPIVISNSYTPTSFLNPTNVAQVSAAISKNKRATGGAAASAETFEILQSKARTKVYSGNKCLQSVLSLHEMCIRVLQKNVDGKRLFNYNIDERFQFSFSNSPPALEYTGGVPYDILEPVLLKCSANQLGNIEYYNPYLTEDTNDLWKKHAQRQFRGKKPREMESWKEMYEVG